MTKKEYISPSVRVSMLEIESLLDTPSATPGENTSVMQAKVNYFDEDEGLEDEVIYTYTTNQVNVWDDESE